MELIPVLDLAHGAAVQARGGDRSRYRPVESVLAPGSPGDAVALLSAYHRLLGARECYVADLDAIQGAGVQHALLGRLARVTPTRLLVDAGAADPGRAGEVRSAGGGGIVVGLETLRSFRDLRAIVDAATADNVVFSLDLRCGLAVLHPDMPAAGAGGRDPLGLADRAVEAGATALLVLDLGRVGSGGGFDFELLRALRRRMPGRRVLAGGGVGGRADLERARDAGCDGVLVATALHTGHIGAADVEALAAAPAAQSSASTSR